MSSSSSSKKATTSKSSSQRRRPRQARAAAAEPPYHLYRDDDNVDDDDADVSDGGGGRGDDAMTTSAAATVNNIRRRKRRRRRRTFQEGFDGVVDLLRDKKRIAVLTGAGLSVSCGIPDFRSNTGLYSTLDVAALGLSCPEELFDYDFFHDDPRPFFKFARHLYFPGSVTAEEAAAVSSVPVVPAPSSSALAPVTDGDETNDDQQQQKQRYRARPSDSHKLLALLEEKKMLLRVYSQNIDGLEEVAGVSNKKIVYAHGSLQWATCCRCRRKTGRKDIESDILQGSVARCKFPVVVKNQKNKQTTVSATATSNTNNKSDENDAQVSGEAAAGSLEQSSATNGTTAPSPRTPTTKAPPIPQREPSTRKRKRSRSSGDDDDNDLKNNSKEHADHDADNALIAQKHDPSLCGGVLKPGVTFFGEALHDQVGRCLEADRDKVDALIVIGTSLSVAPISKVIGYLPPNIPRILINRNVVHPAQPTTTTTAAKATTGTESADHGSEHEEEVEKDFRHDYVFDAYLLGYCDDVTRALGRKLFEVARTTSTTAKDSSTRSDTPFADVEGEVLDRLVDKDNDEDDDSNHSDSTSGLFTCRAAWNRLASRVPPERVFLFPGAQPSSDGSNSHADAADITPSPPTHREIAHCDGCSGRIDGTIRKCEVCFDYDLCEKCFPGLSKTHYDGKHTFVAEAACPEL